MLSKHNGSEIVFQLIMGRLESLQIILQAKSREATLVNDSLVVSVELGVLTARYIHL